MCNENYLGDIPVVNGLLPNSDLLQQFRDEIESDLTRLNPDSAPLPTTGALSAAPVHRRACAMLMSWAVFTKSLKSA